MQTNKDTYQEMIKRIKTMDEMQLVELMHDIDDIELVETIGNCAYYFVENYKAPEEEQTAPNEHFEHDCLQRGRDLASEQKRGY